MRDILQTKGVQSTREFIRLKKALIHPTELSETEAFLIKAGNVRTCAYIIF